jgi:Flp pilus assembly protein TadG
MVGFARKRRRRLGDSGQALVEFALVAPILLLLVLGIVDFGRAFYTYHVMVDAAREGARVGVIAKPSTTADTVAYRINTLLHGAGLDTTNATKTMSGFHAGTDTPFTVSIAYPYTIRWITPFLGWTNAQASFTLNTSAVFRNE